MIGQGISSVPLTVGDSKKCVRGLMCEEKLKRKKGSYLLLKDLSLRRIRNLVHI